MLRPRVNTGFTLIELLIVIVVIAILAAISVVAYSGIRDRANDSAVKNDMRQFGQLVSMYRLENDEYTSNLDQIGQYGNLSVTKDAYTTLFDQTDTGEHNFLYCFNNDINKFGLIARSKSGKYFQYRDGSVSEYTGAAITAVSLMCQRVGVDYKTRVWLYENDWKI